MNKTEEFIAKARKVHGGRYDYSKAKYFKSIEKVSIICNDHGAFLQTPNNHINGNGCMECGFLGTRRSTLAKFIKKAQSIHGDKFDYSKVKYVNAHQMVTIICEVHGEFEQKPEKHFSSKHGCPKCASAIGGKQKSLASKEQFLIKAVDIHGDKFDYSKTVYKFALEKVLIVCKIHGEFEQTPSEHLNAKHGCSMCAKQHTSKSLASTGRQFIEKAKKIHGEWYDYSKVEYTKACKSVTITCPEHGNFVQTPNGCPSCGGTRMWTTDEFILNARKIHGNRYDYSKVEYLGANSKICIICVDHGEFEKIPRAHINGQGCSKCSNRCQNIDTKYFIERASKIHGNTYDYSKVDYVKARAKVIIICKTHKDFTQTPNSHLRGTGCPQCARNCFSKVQIQWLEFMQELHGITIQHAVNGGEHKIKSTKWRADGYCKETNTVYEFHGDFWHGNPKLFDPESLNTVVNQKMKTLYAATMNREKKIKDLGYTLEVMWEADWKRINRGIKQIQTKFKQAQKRE